ncbi:hypothetical protein SAMN05660464_2936 [Geodermatophilus dictyosporus]|uniref:Uncharacterized protein n=1 Tax=Geodermatophilus dictyosporus TaxID=1523247 RepID=A0A1I5PQL5_9ACTN|nr:hypothetical protein [Geodermatophilus dictyosporus]SFP36428.1 hypothetical protein SAMN05660464_2936 [Geodermatophilus dictyosporus]
MILAAGLLVLAGLGLFVAGGLTGVTGWYWACVAACGLAVALLVAARLRAPAAARDTRAAAEPAGRAGERATPATGPAQPPGSSSPDDDHPGRPEDLTASAGRATGHPAPAATGAADASGDPAEEDVEVTDLLIVVDLTDEVLVVDEHPRYHLAGCRWSAGRETVPLPVREARTDGFTPCAVCRPDRHLAEVERTRRAARRS